jgi:opacity protein-like surface antigen
MADKLRSLVSFLLSSIALAAAGTAQAQIYWRLDTGYSISTGADIRDKNYAANQVINGDPVANVPGKLKDVGPAFVLGTGVGTRFTPVLRGDVTLGYRGYKLDSTDGADSNFKADLKSLALMVNAYYENDSASGSWKPYIGAGFGVAQNRFGDFTGTNSAGGTFTGPGATKTGLAWALMAGFAVPISKVRMLDFGYRYIDLGKIETIAGTIIDSGGNPVTTTFDGLTGKLRAHELFVGVRF